MEKALYDVSLVAAVMPKSKATEHVDPDAGRKVDVKGFIEAWDKLGLKVRAFILAACLRRRTFAHAASYGITSPTTVGPDATHWETPRT